MYLKSEFLYLKLDLFLEEQFVEFVMLKEGMCHEVGYGLDLMKRERPVTEDSIMKSSLYFCSILPLYSLFNIKSL